jgi:cytochrome b
VFADAILWLGSVHAAVALWESARHRENLVLSMITGR